MTESCSSPGGWKCGEGIGLAAYFDGFLAHEVVTKMIAKGLAMTCENGCCVAITDDGFLFLIEHVKERRRQLGHPLIHTDPMR